ncbi:MAG: alpha/beta hydrolase [Candidatus Sericytochromatia bacterium]
MKKRKKLYFLFSIVLLLIFSTKVLAKTSKEKVLDLDKITIEDIWKHEYIKANGINFHYVTAGEGPLLILLHGFPENWSTWREQINFLAEKYKVVALDMRGYNLSDKPLKVEDYKLDILTEDIKEVIKAFNYDKATLVAHDWGGAVAWAFAANYSEMLEKLVILNSPHPMTFMKSISSSNQIFHSWYMFFFQIPWLPEWGFSYNDFDNSLDSLRKTATYPDKAFNKEDLYYLYHGHKEKNALTCMINYYRAIFKYPSKNMSKKITTPTLLIWGEKDKFLTKNSIKGIAEYVLDIQIKFFPDASHWVHKDEPELVNKALAEFLYSSNNE